MFKQLKKLLPIKNHILQTTIFGLNIRVSKNKKRKIVPLYRDLPIQNNKIVFRTFSYSYSCNPKYISEEIIRQKLPYELVWVVDKNVLRFIDDFPRDKVKLVMCFSDEDFREASTAKILIDNERRTGYITKGYNKKAGQFYIQTFHGSLGIKKTGVQRTEKEKEYFAAGELDSRQVDYLLSNGSYTTDFLRMCFWNNGEILEYGHPRNDVFFRDTTAVRNKVFKKYGISPEKKIVLYAPTIRKNCNLAPYSIDFLRLKQSLAIRFGGDWVVLYRLHPLFNKLKEKLGCNGTDIINVCDYSDMQELLAASDVVITDYSSCIYDFILLRKPGFIFATDLEAYDNDRGLIYPLSDTPFPIATNNDELVVNIENFDNEKYLIKLEEFLKGKGCIDDGHASERVVELIKKIISEAEKNKIGEVSE